jgi:hypothetical protein
MRVASDAVAMEQHSSQFDLGLGNAATGGGFHPLRFVASLQGGRKVSGLEEGNGGDAPSRWGGTHIHVRPWVAYLCN